MGDRRTMILTPDQRLRVFVSSTLAELAPERSAAREAIESVGLIPVMFELGARPHPPRELYRSYLEQSHVFVGVYWERYGWVAPSMEISGLEDEYVLSAGMPRLLYVKGPAPDREPALARMLSSVEAAGDSSYKHFTTAEELASLLRDDLALLLSERFEARGAESRGLSVQPLPMPSTPLVGRSAELGELVSLLGSGQRLLTITGPGGVGKTRLALEAARRFTSASGFVAFVPLGAIEDPEAVAPTIARTLGAPGGSDSAGAIAEAVGDEHALVVIDNFEQVLSAAPLLVQLLAACEQLQIVVTSRARLRLRGERVFPLHPLGDFGEALYRSLAEAAGTSLSPADEEALPEVCRLLDGLPLAVELAAACSTVMPPARLRARLVSEQRLPVTPHRDLPERQRSIEATLQWSYDLLAPDTTAAFRRLGVFAASFDLDAATAVCEPVAGGQVAEQLATLLDHSLIGSDLLAGQPAFSMLGTVRAFARERLAAERDEERSARESHCSYHLNLATAAHGGLRSRHQAAWCNRLGAMLPDLLAALEWGLGHGRSQDVAAALWALWPFWYVAGALPQGRELTRRASETADLDEPALTRMHGAEALLAFMAGDFEPALEGIVVARAGFERLGEKDGLGHALGVIGLVKALTEGDEEGIADLQEAVSLHERCEDEWGAVLALNALTLALTVLRRSDAKGWAEDTLARAQELGAPEQISMAYSNLARLEVNRGNGEGAWGLARRALEVLRPLRHQPGAASILEVMAEARQLQGDLEQALSLLAMAESLHSVVASPALGLEAERVNDLIARIRGRLDPETFDGAWAAGAGLDFDDALAAALG